MTLRELMNRVESFLFPWPSHAERKASVKDAAREKEESEREVRHAKHVEQQLRRMMEDNHFAENIARQLIDRQGRRYQ